MSELSRLKPPVFQAENLPDIDEKNYSISVGGLVEVKLEFSLEEIKAMPFSSINSRLTSVSGWSVRTDWDGIKWSDFLGLVKPLPEADHVTFWSIGGYSSTVGFDDLANPRVMLVYGVKGEPLEMEYGGPLRTVIPNLWGYKSVKWLAGMDFTDKMVPGYWESRGYTMRGLIEPGITHDVNTGQRRTIKGGEVTEF